MDGRVNAAIASPAPVDANKLLYDITQDVKSARASGKPLQRATSKSLEKLVTCITDGQIPPRTRRWNAVVLLCFAQEWETARNQLSRCKKLGTSFGQLILGDNEELRILGAALVATLWKTKDDLDRIWPIDAYPDLDPTEFPLDLGSVKWFLDLRRFTAAAQDPTVNINPHPSFVAVAAEVDGRHLQIGCELLCIAGHRLTITSTVPKGDTPFFLDIPYGIIHVDATQAILKDPNTGSQDVAPVLRLKLANDPQRRCDLNATKQKLGEAKLFLLNDKCLDRAFQILESAINKHATQRVHSSGAILDASQHAESDSKEEERDNQAGKVPDDDMQMEGAAPLENAVPVEAHPEPADELEHPGPIPMVEVSTVQQGHYDDLPKPLSLDPKGNTKKSTRQTGKKAQLVIADEAPLSSRLRPRKNQQPEKATEIPKAKKSVSTSKAAKHQEEAAAAAAAENDDLWDVPLSPQAAKTLTKKTAKVPKANAAKPAKTKQAARKVKPSHPPTARSKATEVNLDTADSYQSLYRISETPQLKRGVRAVSVSHTIVVEDPVPPQVEDEHIEGADAKSGKQASRKTQLGSRNVWEALVSDAIDEKPPAKPRPDTAADAVKTSSAANKKNKGTLSSNRGDGPVSSSRGAKKPEVPLVNERSARKKPIITFNKHGPRNQGRRLVDQIFGSPDPEEEDDLDMKDLPYPPPPSVSAVQSLASRFATKTGYSNGLQRQLNQASSKGTSSLSKKRPLVGSSSAIGSKKVKMIQPVIDDDDGFIPIEQYESSAFAEAATIKSNDQPKRMLTHITEEGSPVPQETSFEAEDVEAISVDAFKAIQHAAQNQAPSARVAMGEDVADSIMVEDAAESPKPQHTPSYISSSPPIVRPIQAVQVDPFVSVETQETQPSAFAGKLAASATRKGTGHAGKDKTSESQMPQTRQAIVNEVADENYLEPALHVDAEAHPEYAQITEDAILGEDHMDVESNSSSDVDMDEVEAQDKAMQAEWEAALQPRHRTLLASLDRIGRQFVAHIMNCESAFIGEIDRYFQEGLGIVEVMDKKYVAQLRGLQKEVQGHVRHADVVASLGKEYVKVREEALHHRAAWQKMEKMRSQQLKQFTMEMKDGMEA